MCAFYLAYYLHAHTVSIYIINENKLQVPVSLRAGFDSDSDNSAIEEVFRPVQMVPSTTLSARPFKPDNVIKLTPLIAKINSNRPLPHLPACIARRKENHLNDWW